MTPADLMLIILIAGAVYSDLRYRRIPNAFLLPVAVVGLLQQIWFHGLQGAAASLAGLGLGLLLLIIPYSFGGIGGGDVKFLAAVGAVAGASFVWKAFLAGAAAGGILALIQLLLEGRLVLVLRRMGFWLWSFLTPGAPVAPLENLQSERSWGKLPYALPLSIGVFVARLWW